MKTVELRHWDAHTDKHEDGIRNAVLLGAGAVVAGGTLWWAWKRSRPHRREAPGRPGVTPHWNFSSKDGVGTALGPDGRPTGSAMPLAWAHAEYLKLRRSLSDNRVFDTSPQTVKRYAVEKVGSPFAIWRTDHRRRTIPAGKVLRIEAKEPAVIHWDADGGSDHQEARTRDTGLGVHVADLPTANVPSRGPIRFTLSWPEGGWLERKNLYAIDPSVVSVL